jgi:hypothetical protein
VIAGSYVDVPDARSAAPPKGVIEIDPPNPSSDVFQITMNESFDRPRPDALGFLQQGRDQHRDHTDKLPHRH